MAQRLSPLFTVYISGFDFRDSVLGFRDEGLGVRDWKNDSWKIDQLNYQLKDTIFTDESL